MEFRRHKTYVTTGCGHKTSKEGPVNAYGQTILVKLPLRDGAIDYCLDCIAEMTIQCAWCTLPIFIGDHITLYSPNQPDYEVPSFAAIYSFEPLRLVGCARWGCAVSGADFAGNWLPDTYGLGHVQRQPTSFEKLFGDQTEAVVDLVVLSDPARSQPTRHMEFPIPGDT